MYWNESCWIREENERVELHYICLLVVRSRRFERDADIGEP